MGNTRPKPNIGMCSKCCYTLGSDKCKAFHKGTFELETLIFIFLVIFLCIVFSQKKEAELYQKQYSEESSKKVVEQDIIFRRLGM